MLERLESYVTSPCVSDATLTTRRLREMIPCTPSPMYAYDMKLGSQVYDPSGRFLPRFFPFSMAQGSLEHQQGHEGHPSSPSSSKRSSARPSTGSPTFTTSPATPITTPIAESEEGSLLSRSTDILSKLKQQALPSGGFDLAKVLGSFSLESAIADAVALSRDQLGSRFLQQLVEDRSLSAADMESLFGCILPEVKQLTVDPFGNYVVQKVLDRVNEVHHRKVLEKLTGSMAALSVHMYGCRVVQKLIENGSFAQQVAIANELQGHVVECVEDQNGNHVIQKLIEKLSSENLAFIVNEFLGHIPVMAVHCYGCRVVQRLLEKLTPTDAAPLVTEILSHLWELSQDQYGNYVIQHVLMHGTPLNRNVIVQVVARHIIEFSCHKYASNVAEKALLCATDQATRNLLIAAVIGSGGPESPLHVLMKDRFANYVIQRCLEFSQGSQREILVSILKANLPTLKRVIYGKHIANAIEKILSMP